MTVDRSVVGRTFPPGERYEIGLEKVREFAAAIGDANPVHHDRDAARKAGHADVVAPPTFAFALATAALERVLADPRVRSADAAVIHGEQRFHWNRPLRVGDAVTPTVTVESARSSGSRDIVDIRVDLVAEPGEHVAAVSMKLLFLSPPQAGR